MKIVIAFLTLFNAAGEPTETRSYQTETWADCTSKPTFQMVEGQQAVLICGLIDIEKLNPDWAIEEDKGI